MEWDPVQYLKFADERLRPGFDLLARIGELTRGPIIELGCGTGVHTRAIAARWPDHAVTGFDLSAEMLGQASREPSRIRWQQGDIASWHAEERQALVFSNATLQWVDDHAQLMPRLMRHLAAGGVLAIQMPRNFSAPSHVLMREVAAAGPWAERLAPLLRHDPVADPEAYYDMLAPLGRGGIDFWETEYLHILAGPADGESPVLAWTRGTALRPLLEPLTAAERRDFAARYDAALKAAYPRRTDGKTLLPFRRLFMIARA
ncbi:MAG: methyltransferase protein [Rhodospirillales bacterium]|jgi:trans-aconitate 2-methyltransferase|nr:methyltransferase protein [Rhodospirillales bacterium]